MEVDALDGRPGVHSARYAGETATYDDNVNLLLSELGDVPDSQRTARFRTEMALIGDGIEITWEGIAEGRITRERIGAGGFGYDPVFWSLDLQKTFSEAPMDEKNIVSHRGRALRGLLERLDKL